jgi:hypothetical protein
MKVSEKNRKICSRLADKLMGKLSTKNIVLPPSDYDFIRSMLGRGDLLTDAVCGSLLFRWEGKLAGGLAIKLSLFNGLSLLGWAGDKPALLLEIVEDSDTTLPVSSKVLTEFSEEVMFNDNDIKAAISDYLIRFVRGEK